MFIEKETRYKDRFFFILMVFSRLPHIIKTQIIKSLVLMFLRKRQLILPYRISSKSREWDERQDQYGMSYKGNLFAFSAVLFSPGTQNTYPDIRHSYYRQINRRTKTRHFVVMQHMHFSCMRQCLNKSHR
jgi:hypothetical protein